MPKPLLFLILATPFFAIAAEPELERAPESELEPPPALAQAPANKPKVPHHSELVKEVAREAMKQQDEEKAKEKAEAKPDNFGVFSAHPKSDKYTVFAKKFAEARVPSCIGPDALKFNPPIIAEIPGFGPIMAGGIYAIPWLIAAKLKGKCN